LYFRAIIRILVSKFKALLWPPYSPEFLKEKKKRKEAF